MNENNLHSPLPGSALVALIEDYHGFISLASNSPQHVRAHRLIQAAKAKQERLVEALKDALNYWEPDCQNEDCDKGYHVEQLKLWRKAKATLAALSGSNDEQAK